MTQIQKSNRAPSGKMKRDCPSAENADSLKSIDSGGVGLPQDRPIHYHRPEQKLSKHFAYEVMAQFNEIEPLPDKGSLIKTAFAAYFELIIDILVSHKLNKELAGKHDEPVSDR